MKHDISKLHPIHQKNFQELLSLNLPDGGTVPEAKLDELYDFYLDLNETVPDIIGKHEKDMTKAQKARYKAKAKEMNNEPNRG